MSETAVPMHQEGAGAPDAGQVSCEVCTATFKRRKPWQRFCSSRCRQAYHDAEARLEAIRAEAPTLYQALAQIADPQCGDAELVAQAAIKGLKPPVEPKDLLKP